MPDSSPVCRPRNPQGSQYYRCVEDHFEEFEQIDEELFSAKYGFFRPYVKQMIYRYLDCGILHNGFARAKCKDCRGEQVAAKRPFEGRLQFRDTLCQSVLYDQKNLCIRRSRQDFRPRRIFRSGESKRLLVFVLQIICCGTPILVDPVVICNFSPIIKF
jgi:hypothetical protein